MPRSVKEWLGAHDDQRAPPKVRRRIFDRVNGVCHLCSQQIITQKWALDHVVALINGGKNAESNLLPAHNKCHKEKTAADVAEKARVAAIRNAHLGIREVQPRPLQSKPFAPTPRSAKRADRAAAKPALPRRPIYIPEPRGFQSSRKESLT